MKKLLILSSVFVILAFLSASCHDTPSVDKTSPKPTDTNKPITPASAPTLDIIVGGPFIFVQGASCGTQPPPCLAVWAPRVKGHTMIIGLDANGQFKAFDTGAYDFTPGVRPSGKTSIVTPVQDASIYPVSAKTQNIASLPKKKPFATLIFPTPREIVSWNADPITISSNGSPTSAVASKNLATLTVLRYDYQEGDTLEVKAGADTFWKPQPIKNGTERILIIGFVPQNPTPNEDEHAHAIEAFQAATALLGVKWNISFDIPPSTFQRNRPFDPKWPLPQDLLNFIDQIPLETKGAKLAVPLTTSNFKLLGTINDCKAPAMLVTP